MAIIGGAGNPVGGSYTGPAEALEIMGDHCFAYSGAIARSTSDQTMLSFTSGNFYAVTELTCFGIVDNTSAGIGGGETSAFTINMNGTVAFIVKTDTTGSDTTLPNVAVPFLIPPYSEVEVVVVSAATGDGGDAECTIVGRIYRTRD